MNVRLAQLILLFLLIISCEYKSRDSVVMPEVLRDTNLGLEVDQAQDSLSLDTIISLSPETMNGQGDMVTPVDTVSFKKIESINPKEKYPKEKAIITWDSVEINLGEIIEGQVIERRFYFTNTGKAPLQIQKAIPSCGCTLPSFPFISIDPGDRGYIGVSYNSVGKEGSQLPDILIYSNAAKPEDRISMRVFVKPKGTSEKIVLDSIK